MKIEVVKKGRLIYVINWVWVKITSVS